MATVPLEPPVPLLLAPVGQPIAEVMFQALSPAWPGLRHVPLTELKGDAAALVIYDNLDDAARARLHRLIRSVPDRVVCISAPDSQPETLKGLADADALHHVLVVDGDAPHPRDLAATISRMSGANAVGVEAYLGPDAELWSMSVDGVDQLDDAVDFASDTAAEHGVAGALVTLIGTVAGEFLANALHHAPGDDPSPRPVRLVLGSDGGRFAIRVVDEYGSLSSESLQQIPVRVAQPGNHQVARDTWGAGVGLVMAFQSLNHLVIDLVPGRQTSVTGILNIQGGYRRFLRAGRSFNIHVSESL